MATRPRQRARTGRPFPLGATWDGRGVNFAVYSSIAEKIELCLYDHEHRETRRVELPHTRGGLWYGYVREARPGDLYGYRVHGPYKPSEGMRCNPNKLLLDPYAKAIVGPMDWSAAQYGYVPGAPEEDFSFSDIDSAPQMPKSQVIDDGFDWGDDTPPAVPWADTVFYEVHVKGFTKQHPGVREDLRGTYAGLASEASIAHLKQLGVTSVELLPVHAFLDDHHLLERNLSNYWGYNTIGFFAPEMRYGAAEPGPATIAEFKGMVKLLHAAGIEVILDVVYNHTAEGNHLGPTLSFKGFDHGAYYRLSHEDRRYCADYTGTGNTLDTGHSVVVRMITDSLRYWVQQMHVDGFRFDLASTLGRNGHAQFDIHNRFFQAIAKDPVLSKVKLIAEPWDIGDGGYQVGGFPKPWAEWNGGYRDAVRDFWCGEAGHGAGLARPLAGSSETYAPSGRGPAASVNIVTVHDGFPLHDLVSYNGKHNDANGEENRDGENHNRSWNCGAEGETDDEVVLALRERQKRNLLSTLLLSLGTPLLLAGDEMGRTQRGNNNGYCQDNDISWLDWQLDDRRQRLFEFTHRLTALRREMPALRRLRFFTAEADEHGRKDITWLNPQAGELSPEDWGQPHLPALEAMLCGWRIGEQVEGEPAPVGDSLLLLFNRHHEPVWFHLPELAGKAWFPRIDTRTATGLPKDEGKPIEGGYLVTGRSLAVLSQPAGVPAVPGEPAAASGDGG
jgi:glycogen operon protein